MSYILILGAKSDIAKATAREYAKNGFDIYLGARNVKELENFANDIKLRFDRKVQLLELDILNYADHINFYDKLSEKPFGVICAIGFLGDQTKSQVSFDESHQIIDTNFTGIVSLLNIVANDFEKRKSGFIVGISSVAGDRGRKVNYTYGSSKAALSAYLSGLRSRLYSSNIHVMTVKPGFVRTKMTKDIALPDKLTALPEEVARSIYKAQHNNVNTLYTKSIWTWIMLIIKNIPEWKFKSMNI